MKSITKTLVFILPLIASACLKTDGTSPTGPKTIAEQEQDAIAIAGCVTSHWGEDWTQLIAHCASQGYAVFCDVVADIEWALGGKDTGTTAAGTRSLLAKTIKTEDGGTVAAGKSFYTTQPPIARRLAFKKGL